MTTAIAKPARTATRVWSWGFRIPSQKVPSTSVKFIPLTNGTRTPVKVTNGHATAIAEDGADRENDTFAKVDVMDRRNQVQPEKRGQR